MGRGEGLHLHESQRRVRVLFGGQTIADSRRAVLLREKGLKPVYYLPRADVEMELLHATGERTTSDTRGEATRWTVAVGDRVAENAAWTHDDPPAGAEGLADRVAFTWEAMDHWLEEEEERLVGPRDPYRRLDVLASSRHVEVVVDGVVVADSRRPFMLFETGLPARPYIPRADARADALLPSDTTSACPYKGEARYYSLKVGDRLIEDVVWSYPYPNPQVSKIQGMLCFWAEKLDGFGLDGERPGGR
jgi:uncharacterized protein (DUF427 family)